MKRLKAFVQKIITIVASLFAKIPAEYKDAIHVGVLVTENIKTFIDSPTSDILTALIPGEIDNLIKEKLRKVLPFLLTQMRLVDSAAHITNEEEFLKIAVEQFAKINGNIKPGDLTNLAFQIARVLSDGKLSWDDGAYLVKWYYDNKFKNQN